MTVPFHQISRTHPDKARAVSSAENVSHAPDNICMIRCILSAISDDKSLAIFRVIAEHDTSGMESYMISGDLQLTHKKYYRRLANLIGNGLIIRKDCSRRYILTSLGKVVYASLLTIQYAVDNIWRFKAIDAIKICDNDIYKDIGKISDGLVDALVHREHIKKILKKDMI